MTVHTNYWPCFAEQCQITGRKGLRLAGGRGGKRFGGLSPGCVAVFPSLIFTRWARVVIEKRKGKIRISNTEGHYTAVKLCGRRFSGHF